MRERAIGSEEPARGPGVRPRHGAGARRGVPTGTRTTVPAGPPGDGVYLALQRTAGNRKVAALVSNRAVVVQRKGGFRPLDDEAAQKDFAARVAKHQKGGASESQASFLALDDMFAERVAEAGGKRNPKSATPGGGGTATFLMAKSSISYEGNPIDPGLYPAAIDDGVYNCHSYTLDEGKKSKQAQLKGIVKKVPKEGKELAGKAYYEAQDLVAGGIHFAPGQPFGIFPSWVGDDEMRTRLKDYAPLAATAKVKVGDIVVYSAGSALPHSGRVIAVDTKGRPTMIRSKWGHYSLFEHPPAVVPAHYGTPSYHRKK